MTTRFHDNRLPRRPGSIVVFVFLRLNITCLEQLFGSVSQKALQVADEAVDVALACGLVDDVLVVVVAQAATQLLVVHLGLVLADAPAARDLVWVRQLELPAVPRPADEVLARLVRQQLKEELPQLNWATSCQRENNI